MGTNQLVIKQECFAEQEVYFPPSFPVFTLPAWQTCIVATLMSTVAVFMDLMKKTFAEIPRQFAL